MSEHFLQPPPIPDFLDRSKWSPERWERDRRAWDQQRAADRRREHFARKAAERKAKAMRLEAEQRAKRKAERKQLKAERRKRKEQRAADRQLVINLIRSHKLTIGQMSKASGVDQKRLKSAIRWLLANSRIAKASPRTYQEVS